MKKNKYNRKIYYPILAVVLILVLFGLMAVSSASSVLSFQRFGHNYYYFFRQGVSVLLGLLAIYVFSRVDYRRWREWSRPLMLIALVALAAVLIPGLGTQFGGSRSWFTVGPFTVQPSEFAKLAVVFYLASWFERKEKAEENFIFGILPPLAVSGFAMALIAIEPDLGTAMMIGVIVFVTLFATGAKLKYILGLLGAAAAAVWALIISAPYRAARITSFFNPSIDPLGIGYHINQALLAIGSGGFWGLGLGDSRQKHNFLPEPIGDSIFAVMAEELGFVRIAIIILLFGLFAVLGLHLASKAPDRFSHLVVVGIVAWVSLQAIINIGAVSNVLPLTGLTLPFISYGGSSMVALGVAVGVMLNISKYRI
jgi:cell division protein FtsW